MKLPFMVSKCDQLMSCMKANYIMPSFSIFDSKLQVRFQEGEQYLLPCAPTKEPQVHKLYLTPFDDTSFPNTMCMWKPRTVSDQEGENDVIIWYPRLHP